MMTILFVAEDLSIAQGDNAAGLTGNVHIMSDDDQRHALLVQRLKERHHLFAGLGVEGAGRLVGQENTGVVDQGATRCCWPPEIWCG